MARDSGLDCEEATMDLIRCLIHHPYPCEPQNQDYGLSDSTRSMNRLGIKIDNISLPVNPTFITDLAFKDQIDFPANMLVFQKGI